MTNLLKRLALGACLVSALACGDLLDVENPGPYDDSDLDNPAAMPGLVTGMSFDLSRGLDDVLQNSSIMGDDLYHGGSYGPQGLFNRGIIEKENVNGMWGGMHRARWVAEHGIERLKRVLGTGYDSTALAVRANIYAGFANRLLGEHVCEAVIDGGPREDFTIHFERAEAQFTEALRIIPNLPGTNTAANRLRDSLRRAASGGRASVRAWQGKWTEAAADAANVPTSYVFVAFFSTNTPAENNDLAFETINRKEYTVFNTQWAQVRDPRVPWDTVRTTGGAIEVGQDGRTPFFQQKKYTSLASDVPLTKGTEMLMLRAEERLRAGDVNSAMTLINLQRAFYGVTPALTATTEAEAWPILQKERAAVLWNEGRRFWDLRRWNAEPPPIKNTFLDNRDKCIPVSENEEQSNPNV
jgi:hypothetical protein